MCSLSFKKVNDGTGRKKKGWVLTVKGLTHVHNWRLKMQQLSTQNTSGIISITKSNQEKQQISGLQEKVIMNTFDFRHNQATF